MAKIFELVGLALALAAFCVGCGGRTPTQPANPNTTDKRLTLPSVSAIGTPIATKPDTTTEKRPTLPPKFERIEGKRYLENSIGMVFVQVPAGKFTMGSPKDEKGRGSQGTDETQHEVEITQSFYLGVYTVTQEEYERVMGKNPSCFSVNGTPQPRRAVEGLDTRRFPVEGVSWQDSQNFCTALSKLEKENDAQRTYRLPTEAEWEYACRGGATSYSPYHYGNTITSDQANFGESKLKRPTWVGSYKPNAFGLYDMHGNVSQWCQDWYAPYARGSQKDPEGPASGPDRVARGGNWFQDDCRSARRHRVGKGIHVQTCHVGFRVVLVSP